MFNMKQIDEIINAIYATIKNLITNKMSEINDMTSEYKESLLGVWCQNFVTSKNNDVIFWLVAVFKRNGLWISIVFTQRNELLVSIILLSL